MSIQKPTCHELRALYLRLPPDLSSPPRQPSIPAIKLSEKQLERLLQAIGRIKTPYSLETLRTNLSKAAEYFPDSLWLQESPALSVLEREFLVIHNLASKLSRLLRSDPNDVEPLAFHMRSWLQIAADDYGSKVGRPRGIEPRTIPWNFWTAYQLPVVVQSVELLAHLAELGANRLRKELTGKTKGTAFGVARKMAMRVLIHRLALEWLHAKEEAPREGSDINTGKASGPFFRFSASFLEAMRSHVTDEHRKYLPTIDAELSATPDMVRAHLKIFRFQLLPKAERERAMVKSKRKKH